MTADSPFNWKSKPSVFAKDPDLNGINARRSRQASALKKNDLYICGNDPRTLHNPANQVNTYGRAVVAKTKKEL